MAREWPQETGHHVGYDRVSLAGLNEAGPGGANQVEETSTGVAAWWKEMETAVASNPGGVEHDTPDPQAFPGLGDVYSSPECAAIRRQVIEEEGRVCAECGKRINNDIDISVDHKLPRSKYPDLALDREGLCVLSRNCNSKKGAR